MNSEVTWVGREAGWVRTDDWYLLDNDDVLSAACNWAVRRMIPDVTANHAMVIAPDIVTDGEPVAVVPVHAEVWPLAWSMMDYYHVRRVVFTTEYAVAPNGVPDTKAILTAAKASERGVKIALVTDKGALTAVAVPIVSGQWGKCYRIPDATKVRPKKARPSREMTTKRQMEDLVRKASAGDPRAFALLARLGNLPSELQS